MPTPSKACKFCGEWTHWPFQCRENPKNKNRPFIKKKTDNKWLKTRDKWFTRHPATYYLCYICGTPMARNETTLDHVMNRSHEELKYELSNLMPCCRPCNYDKGSKSLGRYILERRKRGLYVSSEAYRVAKRFG